MQTGSLVIARDLLGFLTSSDNEMSTIKDKNGKLHKVRTEYCAEIISPYGLAYLNIKESERTGATWQERK